MRDCRPSTGFILLFGLLNSLERYTQAISRNAITCKTIDNSKYAVSIPKIIIILHFTIQPVPYKNLLQLHDRIVISVPVQLYLKTGEL